MALVSGAVVAGGRSRRMGRDKRHLDVDGVALLARAVAAVSAVADDVHVIVAADEDLTDLAVLAAGAQLHRDRRQDQGPLAGLEVALTRAAHEVVVVLAGDHPYGEPAVLRLLASRLAETPDALAATIVTDRGPQPLVAAYRRAALTQVVAHLDAGERRATVFLDALEPIRVDAADWQALDPAGRTALDVDTPDDVARLEMVDPSPDALGPDEIGRTSRVEVVSITPDGARTGEDRVVGEEPLEVRAHGPGQQPAVLLTTLRTPGHEAETAAGWLLSEGLIGPGGIVEVVAGDPVALARPDDQVTVHLADPLDLSVVAHRHTVATASCGVCGRASIDELGARAAAVPADVPAGGPVAWSTITALPDRLRVSQDVFEATGSIHATGLFDRDGSLVTLREDVGRHNALDAAIGVHVLAGTVPLHDLVCVLSGRIGFELVAKAAVAGIPIVAAVGAPSDLAVRTADRFGVTLVGFLRGGVGNVYTHRHRIDPYR